MPQRAQDHIQFHVDGSSCLLFSFQFYFNSISFLQERERVITKIKINHHELSKSIKYV